MKMYASCPICGYKLCKGESGSDVDILCPPLRKARPRRHGENEYELPPPAPLKRR